MDQQLTEQLTSETDLQENYTVMIRRNAYSGYFDRVAISNAYVNCLWIQNRVQLIDLINVADKIERRTSRFFWARFCYYSILTLLAFGFTFFGIGISNWAYHSKIKTKTIYFLDVTWPFVVAFVLIPLLIIGLYFIRLCVLNSYQITLQSQMTDVNNKFEKRNLYWKVGEKCYYIQLSIIAVVGQDEVVNQSDNVVKLSKIIDKSYLQIIPDKRLKKDSISLLD